MTLLDKMHKASDGKTRLQVVYVALKAEDLLKNKKQVDY